MCMHVFIEAGAHKAEIAYVHVVENQCKAEKIELKRNHFDLAS